MCYIKRQSNHPTSYNVALQFAITACASQCKKFYPPALRLKSRICRLIFISRCRFSILGQSCFTQILSTADLSVVAILICLQSISLAWRQVLKLGCIDCTICYQKLNYRLRNPKKLKSEKDKSEQSGRIMKRFGCFCSFVTLVEIMFKAQLAVA